MIVDMVMAVKSRTNADHPVGLPMSHSNPVLCGPQRLLLPFVETLFKDGVRRRCEVCRLGLEC